MNRFAPLLLLVAAAPAVAQAFGAEAIARARDEAVTLVEAATGRRFDPAPEVRVVDEAGLREVVRAAQTGDPGFDRFGPDAREKLVAELSAKILGAYSLVDGKVHVSPEHLQKAYAAVFEPGREAEYLLLLLVHELVHALDDQSYGLAAKVREFEDEEARLAFEALFEGHAVAVEERVASERGSNDLFEARFASFTSPPAEGTLPPFFVAFVQQSSIFPYVEGRVFVRESIAGHGPEVVDRLFRHPPRTTAEILDPSRYFEPRPAPPELARIEEALAAIEESLGGEGWSAARSDHGARDLYFSLLGQDEETRRALVRSLTAGRMVLARSEANPMITVRAVVFSVVSTAEGARAMVDAKRTLEAEKDDFLASVPAVKIHESVESELELGGWVGYARMRRYQALVMPQRTWFAVLARGRVVVEVAIANDEPGEALVRERLEVVLSKFPE